MINRKLLLASLLAGFSGALLGHAIGKPTLAWAGFGDKVQVMNAMGRVVGDLFAPSEGGGIMDLYSEKGDLRVQIGSYGSGGEKGQPLIGLSDNSNRLRFLIRLAGKNESPVVIFKDHSGRDRMVMGLDMSDFTEEPFLATFDYDGKKKMIFGKY